MSSDCKGGIPLNNIETALLVGCLDADAMDKERVIDNTRQLLQDKEIDHRQLLASLSRIMDLKLVNFCRNTGFSLTYEGELALKKAQDQLARIYMAIFNYSKEKHARGVK